MEGKINYRDWVGGALIGGSIGALLGLLLAPKSGRELRTDLKGEAREVYSHTHARTGDLLEKAGQQIHQARAKIRGIVGTRSVGPERSPQDLEAMEEPFGEA